MPDTVRLAIHAPDEAREALVARLAAAGFDAFEDTPAALVAYAPEGAVSRDAVGETLGAAGLGWEHAVETTVPDQNWNAAWEATIQPTRVGPFVVAPTWADLPADLAALTVLRIDPKMAFGTGYHESTRLALRLLASRVPPGGRVLDVGTGTGVLALAALKTGAASAVGVDIDPWSVANARENAGLNGVADRFENRLGSVEEVPEDGFGLVLANILRVILVPMMPELAARLAPGGTVVLAGILQSEREVMLAAAAASGLVPAEEATENEWWAVALTTAAPAEPAPAVRVCAIDVGTNTVQSLVADVTADGRLAVVADEERFARLGQGVDASHRLAPEAMDRAVACLRAALDTATRLGAERVVIGATSASRDASNVADLAARVRDELGLDFRVLPGDAEAVLSFRGALSRWATAPDGPVVVVDIGGGSTEVALGTRAGGVASRTSLDVGSVRLSERHFLVRPPTPEEVAAARADVVRAAAAIPAAIAEAVAAGAPVVATGSVARMLGRLAGFDTAGGGGAPAPRVPASAVSEWSARLLALTPAETLALDREALAGREDVAAASVLVLDTVLAALGAAAYVPARGGLRHGLALREGMEGVGGKEGVGGTEGGIRGA